MKVILRETISSLGIIGSEVNVADGYARNYLLPQKKAVVATEQNRRVLEQEKAKLALQMQKEADVAKEAAEKIDGVVLEVPSRVLDETRLYGSVTVRDIASALEKQNISVEKRMILLPEAIKELGSYPIEIRLYDGVSANISVNVVAEE